MLGSCLLACFLAFLHEYTIKSIILCQKLVSFYLLNIDGIVKIFHECGKE